MPRKGHPDLDRELSEPIHSPPSVPCAEHGPYPMPDDRLEHEPPAEDDRDDPRAPADWFREVARDG